ncbi:outer-membrane lipoprotein carrier protein LolA [Sulfurivirga sp.]|uniref:LolA family protein n=1 Tax=Sulfurivirga sp. TaxID=2614236 RepID=UPI0025E0153B|nr:outer-membrane lipoprotein carrier protein LolA [Sulfurivirga sp.]
MRWIVALIMILAGLHVPAFGADLQQFANTLRTFEADFVQETPRAEDELMGVDIRSGHVVLERPGRLYWHYRNSRGQEPQTLVADGRAFWIYDPELEQVTVQPINQVIRDIPLNWLLYDVPVEMNFRVRPLGKGEAGLNWFALTPRRDTFFQSLEVGLDGDNVLRRIRFYQSHDRLTRIRFENVRVNQPVNEALFHFRVPKGVDVVGRVPR